MKRDELNKLILDTEATAAHEMRALLEQISYSFNPFRCDEENETIVVSYPLISRIERVLDKIEGKVHEPTFTPGPWEADGTNVYGNLLRLGYSAPMIIQPWKDTRDEFEEAVCNAALIACAPKMLSKLEEIRKYLPKLVRDSVDKLIAEAKKEVQ